MENVKWSLSVDCGGVQVSSRLDKYPPRAEQIERFKEAARMAFSATWDDEPPVSTVRIEASDNMRRLSQNEIDAYLATPIQGEDS